MMYYIQYLCGLCATNVQKLKSVRSFFFFQKLSTRGCHNLAVEVHDQSWVMTTYINSVLFLFNIHKCPVSA